MIKIGIAKIWNVVKTTPRQVEAKAARVVLLLL